MTHFPFSEGKHWTPPPPEGRSESDGKSIKDQVVNTHLFAWMWNVTGWTCLQVNELLVVEWKSKRSSHRFPPSIVQRWFVLAVPS